MAAFDKKGKEAYFDVDSAERNLQEAVRIRIMYPKWTIFTDDWGYFERANYENIHNISERYSNYDVFIIILIVTLLTSLLWISSGFLEIRKFTFKYRYLHIYVFFLLILKKGNFDYYYWIYYFY